MQRIIAALEKFGFGRLAAIMGSAFGLVAVLVMLMGHIGGDAKSLLYGNLDLKESSQIANMLDQAGIKYEIKGDGTTLLVDRDKVASARMMLSSKGLPTSGSVGYEIFDSAPALGQTDFIQNINAKRAAEGELARTIRSIQGISQAKVLLNIPKHALFEQEQDSPSASVMIETAGRKLTSDQVRSIRNLVAAATPNLKPDRVAITDQTGMMLAGIDEADNPGGALSTQKNELEEKIKRQVRDLVEGVVGSGKARVTVTADVDETRTTTQEEKFDPDGQVVRSSATNSDNSKEDKPLSQGGVSASQNLPTPTGAIGGSSVTGGNSQTSNASKSEETTNYEISKSVKTTIQEPGQIKKLSVSVAVDGLTTPGVGGKAPGFIPRSAEDIQKIESLVRAAIGFDEKRGDQLQVIGLRFDHPQDQIQGSSGLDLSHNDMIRIAEMIVLFIVTGLLMVFVVRPMLKPMPNTEWGGLAKGGMPPLQFAGSGAGAATLAGANSGNFQGVQIENNATLTGSADGAVAALPNEFEHKIEVAKIEGLVRSSSVKKVSAFIEAHPEESVAILRTWLHET